MITQDDAVAEVLAKRTVSLDVAAASIPMGRNKAHRLVREGRFPVPVIPLGDHGVVVPTPELRRLLQLPNETQEGGELMSNVIEMDAFIESGNVIDKTGACEDCGCRTRSTGAPSGAATSTAGVTTRACTARATRSTATAQDRWTSRGGLTA